MEFQPEQRQQGPKLCNNKDGSHELANLIPGKDGDTRNPLMLLKLAILNVSLCPMNKTPFSPIDVPRLAIQCPIDGLFLFQHNGPNIYIPSCILIQFHRAFHPTTRTPSLSIDVPRSAIQCSIDGSFLFKCIGPTIYILLGIHIQSHQAFFCI